LLQVLMPWRTALRSVIFPRTTSLLRYALSIAYVFVLLRF